MRGERVAVPSHLLVNWIETVCLNKWARKYYYAVSKIFVGRNLFRQEG